MHKRILCNYSLDYLSVSSSPFTTPTSHPHIAGHSKILLDARYISFLFSFVLRPSIQWSPRNGSGKQLYVSWMGSPSARKTVGFVNRGVFVRKTLVENSVLRKSLDETVQSTTLFPVPQFHFPHLTMSDDFVSVLKDFISQVQSDFNYFSFL